MEFKSGQVVKLKVRYRNEHAYFWNPETNDFVYQNHHRYPELYSPNCNDNREVARYVKNSEIGLFVKTLSIEGAASHWNGPVAVDVVIIGDSMVAFEHRRIRGSFPRKYESKIKRITVLDHRREE